MRHDGFHVLCTLKICRIVAVLLAHATTKLLDRLVVMFRKPLAQFRFNFFYEIQPVLQQNGTEHGHIRSRHQHFNDVFSTVDAAGCSKIRLYTTVENCDPAQRQAHVMCSAQLYIRLDRKSVQIDIGLVETIKEHETFYAQLIESSGHMGHIAEKWT
jgi:hypothetical protein